MHTDLEIAIKIASGQKGLLSTCNGTIWKTAISARSMPKGMDRADIAVFQIVPLQVLSEESEGVKREVEMARKLGMEVEYY